ncbi:MAG: hypothetical protein ACM3VS_10645 [Candidatus Dadabacteria bacterium]
MKKLLLSLCFFSASFFLSFNSSAQTIVEDAIAAMEKGHVSAPTPKILKTLATPEWVGMYNEVKDFLVWYKYKGLFYSVLIDGIHVGLAVFAPNGEFLGFYYFDL